MFSITVFCIYCTYCSTINEEGVEVHEHPSGLFGVGLLVEVSIEVAQLRA